MSKEMLEYLKRQHVRCLELSRQLKFDKNLRADGIVVSLYGTLIELTGSLVALIEVDRTAGVSAVFRSFLEAYVDLKNLLENSDYLNHMLVDFHIGRVRMLKYSQNGNPYLADIAQIDNLDEFIQDAEVKISDLKGKGFRSLKVFERFQMADMENVYRSVYLFESGRTHNELGALFDRHIEAEGDDFVLAYYKDRGAEHYTVQLDSAAAMLMDATSRLHHRLKSDCQSDVELLAKELQSLRDSLFG